MTTVPPLSDEDREALRRSVRDLSDIAPQTRARIDADFRRAHRAAEEIRQGVRDPLR
jgi:hypothetical protein